MGHLPQNINYPLSLRSEIENTGGLVATPFTGAVNDVVLLFTAAGTVTGPGIYITEVNDANNGTSVTVTKAGLYSYKLYFESFQAADIVFGVSQDVAAAGLTGAPSFAIAGFLDVQASTGVAAEVSKPLEIAGTFIVSPEQEVAGTVIRFHASTPAGAAPAAILVQATAYYRIRRINQAHE